ncbi:glycosyltransferase family 25 protein [uncultured Hoeflea sp.]|uniref:glycosyltransferase family 25 protein n=1 Tax=uncultured Hoeflea sp. TaxID=538666 RepID=UPI00260A4288|nr:glycosyltransferase family 25 protein [uncultured Hoeflea sp.]
MSGTGDIEAFIIHLARAEARRSQVDRIRSDCPLPVRILDAVDGRALSPADIDAVYCRSGLHTPRYPFEPTIGEIGCFLSHRKAWQAIVASGLEAGLVFEDDVQVDTTAFRAALDLARTHISQYGIIQFQVREITDQGPAIASADAVRLTRPVLVPLRASCTLYSRQAAQQLLDRTLRFDRPVDTFMQMHWLTGLRPLIAVPSGVGDNSREIGGTTIQAKNLPWLKRLRREVLRPLYRARIRALSRSNDQPPD